MYCEMPDHPAASWSVGKSVAVALNVEKPNDLASVLSHELDSRLLVALLLTLDRVEERGVEERQHAAPQPALLVAVDVRANHDAHSPTLWQATLGVGAPTTAGLLRGRASSYG